jgi:hypothetical protein
LIVLSVVISVAILSVSITIFLLHRYTEDVVEKDRLHMKGLASSVKGFIDHAFSLNYLLSIRSTATTDSETPSGYSQARTN